MTQNTTLGTVLVTGSSGTTGRRLTELLRKGGHDVRAASRTSGHRFDWLDRSTWEPALKGVEALYLLPYDPEPLTADFVRTAVDLGVQRIVLLSGRGVDVPGYGGEGNEAVAHHLAGEEAVRTSGAEWTILRPGWFAQNLSVGFLREDVVAGELRLADGDVPVAFVDAEDISAVAAEALTGTGHSGQVYELTGPRALTLDEVAEAISAGSGRSVRHVRLTPEKFVAEKVAQGMSEEDARDYEAVLSPIRLGLDSHVSDGVRLALGRPPRPFSAFVEDAEASGAWNS